MSSFRRLDIQKLSLLKKPKQKLPFNIFCFFKLDLLSFSALMTLLFLSLSLSLSLTHTLTHKYTSYVTALKCIHGTAPGQLWAKSS